MLGVGVWQVVSVLRVQSTRVVLVDQTTLQWTATGPATPSLMPPADAEPLSSTSVQALCPSLSPHALHATRCHPPGRERTLGLGLAMPVPRRRSAGFLYVVDTSWNR